MEHKEELYLSLGSNLGGRRKNLRIALDFLEKRVGAVLRCSSLYETEPVGIVKQRDFINLCCRIETNLEPTEILTRCLEIERMQGRERTVDKGPRNIDIDLLLYGNRIISEPGLELPHPAFRNRRFVLLPLAEIAADARDPVTGRSVQDLLEACPDPARVSRKDPPFPLPIGGIHRND